MIILQTLEYSLDFVLQVFLYDFAKALCLGKIRFFCYSPKYSKRIRLQDSLVINISGSSQSISQIFCMEMIIKGRQHVRLPFLVGCDQMYLLLNQISVFFNHQDLWKELIDILVFLVIKGSQHLRLPLLIGCDQLCHASSQTAGFFGLQYLWKESIYILT